MSVQGCPLYTSVINFPEVRMNVLVVAHRNSHPGKSVPDAKGHAPFNGVGRSQ